MMNRKPIFLLLVPIVLCLVGCDGHPSVLNPMGIIAFKQRELLFDTTALMLIVAVPVIVMSFDFVTHYRQGSKHKVEYKPEWCHSVFLEAIWWGVPCAIILVLAILTWIASHRLDPYRTIHYPGEVIPVKVVALPWKWLFIYPEANVASLNELVIPERRQVEFKLTSDNVPMSAFFIPQLGSQIYTMAGMQTKLHLVATDKATITGMNSQYNGDGFSDMHFKVRVVSPEAYQQWLSKAKQSPKQLNDAAYARVRKPKMKAEPEVFGQVNPNLFKNIIASYQAPKHPAWNGGA